MAVDAAFETVAGACPPPLSLRQSNQQEIPMPRAAGPFEVKLAPLDPYNQDNGAGIARMAIDKQFHGDLEAASKGEMIAAGSAKGSGGYVAMERVSGSLHGRNGSFALQHNATMTNAVPYLNI